MAARDHPRAGGEKCSTAVETFFSMGSPPRRRGKAYLYKGETHTEGITPAQAGKSLWSNTKSTGSRDHPRAGGEKQIWCERLLTAGGSPPRRRGKVLRCQTQPAYEGITPAQAGKRPGQSGKGHRLWDHPRAGGEKVPRIGYNGTVKGSPPRRRGKGRRTLPEENG